MLLHLIAYFSWRGKIIKIMASMTSDCCINYFNVLKWSRGPDEAARVQVGRLKRLLSSHVRGFRCLKVYSEPKQFIKGYEVMADYTCMKCGKTFDTYNALKAHTKRAHPRK